MSRELWKPEGALPLSTGQSCWDAARTVFFRAILVCFTEINVDPFLCLLRLSVCPSSISCLLFYAPSISTLIALVLTFIFLLPYNSPRSGPNGLLPLCYFLQTFVLTVATVVQLNQGALSLSQLHLTLWPRHQDQSHRDTLSPASRQLFTLTFLPSTLVPAHSPPTVAPFFLVNSCLPS